MQGKECHNSLGKLADIVLLLQPYLPFFVMLSVVAGSPPLWLSWALALLPLPIRYLHKRVLFRRSAFDLPIAVLTAGMLYGYFASPAPQLASQALNTYLAGVLMYYGIVNNRDAGRHYWLFFGAFFAAIFLALSLSVFASGSGKFVGFNDWIFASFHITFTWFLVSTNVIGYMLAVAIPLLVAFAAFSRPGRARTASWIMIVIFAAILFFSVSAGGWVNALIGLLLVAAFLPRKTKLLAAATSLVLASATFRLGFGTQWIGVVFRYDNLIGRMNTWKATLDTLREHPIGGLGLGGWWSSVNTQILPGGPHNSYLQLYSDTGVLGLAALAIAAIIGIRMLVRLIKADRRSPAFGITLGLLAALAASAADGVIDNVFVVLTQTRTQAVCFTVPMVFILMAGLDAALRRLESPPGLSNTAKLSS